MPLPARELKITYNGLVLGSTSSKYYLDAPVRIAVGPDQASVQADVIVVGTSESNFATNCSDLEAAFRVPRAALEVKFGSSTHASYDSTDAVNSGFNQRPSAVKVGDINSDTGRSRRYRIEVVVDLPAATYLNSDGSSTTYRRNATVNLYTTPSGRRRLTVTGQYTASAGVTARAQYEANITDYVTTLTTAFGGTWESLAAPLDPQVATDDQNKVCNFSVVLEEVIFNQLSGTVDDTTLRRPTLNITRGGDLSGDSIVFGIKAQRLQRIIVDYSVHVDRATTALETLWRDTIRPYLITLAKRVADSSSGFIESEIPTFDFVENRITARLTFVSPPGGTLLSARITTDESSNTGFTLVPVWGSDRLLKHRFTGPAAMTRTVTVVVTEVGNPSDHSVVGPGGVFDAAGEGGALGANAAPGDVASQDAVSVGGQALRGNSGLATVGGVEEPTTSPDGGNLVRLFLGAVHSTTPRRIGPLTGESLNVTDRVVVARYEYYVDAAENDDYTVGGGGDSFQNGPNFPGFQDGPST